MESRRVTQRDLVHRKIVGVTQNDHGGHALRLVEDFGLVREIPPGYVLAEQFGSAASIDGAFTHDAAVLYPIAKDERLAAVAPFAENAPNAGGEIVDARVARSCQK